METLLVVDDEPAIRSAIGRYPDLAILDQKLPDGAGLDLVTQLRAIDPDIPVVLLTGHGSVDLAVEALKQGVTDFIEKPFKLERLRTTVGLLLEKQQLGRQVARLSGKSQGRQSMVAASPGCPRRRS
jgi:DNA-binding NtrC family response regulator